MRKRRLAIQLLILLAIIAFIFVYLREKTAYYCPSSLYSNSFAPPKHLAEIHALYPPLPKAENGAEYFIQAHDAYKEIFSDPSFPPIPILGDDKYELTLPSTPLPAEMLANINTILNVNQESLRLIRIGANSPFNKIPIDFSPGFNTEFTHLSAMRANSHLTQLAAIYHAENNDPAKAAEYLIDSLAIAQSLDKVPSLLPILVHFAVIELSLDATEQVLNRTQLSDSDLLRLQQILGTFDELQNAKLAYQGENWMIQTPLSLTRVQIIHHGKRAMIHEIERADRADNTYDANRDDDELYYLNLANDIGLRTLTKKEFQLAETKLHTSFKNTQKSADKKYNRVIQATLDSYPTYYRLTQQEEPETNNPDEIMLPGLPRFATALLRCEANLRLAQSALAIERYALQHGDIPETLEQLSPQYIAPSTLLEPYYDQPLTYTIFNDHYTLSCLADPSYNERIRLQNPNNALPGITFTVYHVPPDTQ